MLVYDVNSISEMMTSEITVNKIMWVTQPITLNIAMADKSKGSQHKKKRKRKMALGRSNRMGNKRISNNIMNV